MTTFYLCTIGFLSFVVVAIVAAITGQGMAAVVSCCACALICILMAQIDEIGNRMK